MSVWRILETAICKSSLADWLVAVATVVIAFTSFYQWRAIRGQLAEMRNTGSQTQQLIDATRKSAEAAIRTADIADATLKSSQKSFQVDLRPYVISDGPPQFVVPPNAAGKPIEANVVLRDIGRTPAINAVWFVDLLPYAAKTRPEYLRFLENSYVNLRKRQETTIEKHAAEMARDIAPTAATFSSENTRALSALEMTDLEKADGSFILLSVGIVSYTDALKGSYETEFCYYFVGTDPKVWHICDSHNTIR